VGRTGVLTIDDLVEVRGIGCIRGIHGGALTRLGSLAGEGLIDVHLVGEASQRTGH
jgi:hypothetical protein